MATDREELIILSEHLQAVGRERDYWKKQAEEFEDELVLAREALARLHADTKEKVTNKRVTVGITSVFDEENYMMWHEGPMTDQDLMDWARDNFIDDINRMVKFNEVVDFVHVAIQEDES